MRRYLIILSMALSMSCDADSDSPPPATVYDMSTNPVDMISTMDDDMRPTTCKVSGHTSCFLCDEFQCFCNAVRGCCCFL